MFNIKSLYFFIGVLSLSWINPIAVSGQGAVEPPDDWVNTMMNYPADLPCAGTQSLIPDGNGYLYGIFRSCQFYYRQEISSGTWTIVAGDGNDPLSTNAVTTVTTGTSGSVHPGRVWFGSGSRGGNLYIVGGPQKHTYHYNYLTAMETGSGSYGITVMAGDGADGTCSDGSVPTPGGNPTSKVSEPSWGVYSVSEDHLYVPLEDCATIMRVDAAYPYSAEVEWAGEVNTGSLTVALSGTNDPAAVAGGASKPVLMKPVALTLDSQEKFIWMLGRNAVFKIDITLRISTLTVGRGMVSGQSNQAGFGTTSADLGTGMWMDWWEKDALLFILAWEAPEPLNVITVDTNTLELKILSNLRTGPAPGVSGTVAGPMTTTGSIHFPTFYRDRSTSGIRYNKWYFCSDGSAWCGWVSSANPYLTTSVSVSASDSEDVPTPAPIQPTPVPTPQPPLPPTPQPLTPVPSSTLTPPSPIPPASTTPSSSSTTSTGTPLTGSPSVSTGTGSSTIILSGSPGTTMQTPETAPTTTFDTSSQVTAQANDSPGSPSGSNSAAKPAANIVIGLSSSEESSNGCSFACIVLVIVICGVIFNGAAALVYFRCVKKRGKNPSQRETKYADSQVSTDST